MKIRTDITVFIAFLILMSSLLVFSVSSHVKKGGERMAERKIFVDSLFAEFSLYGEIIDEIIVRTSGRPNWIWCIEVIKSSNDSFYIFSRKHRTALKIQRNLAVMVAILKDHERPRFIDINTKYPGMITLYDNNLEIIGQYPMNSRFGTGFLYEQDMRICDHLILE